MKKTSMLLGATILMFSAAFLLPMSAQAYKGDPNVKGPNYTVERHDAMTKAFANKDYNAWKVLMDGRGVVNKITASNFAKFAEAHQLALDGKTQEAAKIRAELGLGQQNGSGMGQGQRQGRMSR